MRFLCTQKILALGYIFIVECTYSKALDNKCDNKYYDNKYYII